METQKTPFTVPTEIAMPPVLNGPPPLVVGTASRLAENRESLSPLLTPNYLAFLTMVAGLLVSGPMVGITLIRLNMKRTGLIIAALMTGLGLLLYPLLIFWPTTWYWTSLTLAALHIGSATAVFIYMRKLFLEQPLIYRTQFAVERRRDKTYVAAGIAGGLAMSATLGSIAMVVFLLITDRFFYNLMPVAFDDMQSMVLLAMGLFCLGLAGAIAGGQLGRLRLRLSPARMILYTLGFIWVSLTWLLAMQVIIAIPGAQAGQASGGREAMAIMFPFFAGNFFIGVWWSPFVLLYVIRPVTKTGTAVRLIQAPFINLAAAMVLAIFFGYTIDIFHAAGRAFERRANIPMALMCYEHGLAKSPNASSASYLQYRVALLAHKLGEREKAENGFRKVVSKYPEEKELVKKANYFLDSLSQAGENDRRVTLPGVETPTAHMGAYCVPNSLALVMRFWGSSVDARDIGQRITGLNRGTSVVDQAWFAEQEGFRHVFLPEATTGDIKTAIDAGFPVLVYVPAHVFAIVGYDDILDTFVTYDVATQDVWEDYIRKDFVRSWKKQSTTLVLVYPPEQEKRVPESMRERLAKSRDAYLHFHLQYLNGPEMYADPAHLIEAAKPGGLFLARTILYKDFPGIRSVLGAVGDDDPTAKAIVDFFGNDFDEGTHLWGQRHYEDYAQSDEPLIYGLEYLIGQRRFSVAQELISRIETHGEISNYTRNTRGMIDLSLGQMESGVARLNETDDNRHGFYLSLGRLALEDQKAAVTGLVKTVDGCT